MLFLYLWLTLCAGIVLGMCLNAFFQVGTRYDEDIESGGSLDDHRLR